MRRIVSITWLLVGCSYTPPRGASPDDGGPQPRDGEPIDATDAAPADSPFDAPPSVACFGDFARVCLPALPASGVQLNSGNNLILDTDTDARCETLAEGSIVNACVLAGTSVQIDGMVSAHGSRPLIILATSGSFQIASGAVVDVSSRVARDTPGAGARGVCADGAGGADAGAGGPGGTYGSKGGKGGNSGIANGGTSGNLVALAGLLGGCSGGDGGSSAGSHGQGGGAIALVSNGTIIVDGTVNASGGGGKGAKFMAGNIAPRGGGGGGSGGMIAIDCDDFLLNSGAILLAQGGGGGEGNSAIDSGENGDDPAIPGTNAPGGSTNATGGDGGDGATSGNGGNGENAAAAADGGGAGGGGKGFIIDSTAGQFTNNGAVSPAPLPP